MNEKTVYTYENSNGKLVFSCDSSLWITDVTGISSVEIDISEAQGPGQVGASIVTQSVRSRSITVDGAIFDPIAYNRARVLDVISPGTPATLTVEENGQSWYLDVVPEKTPEIMPGNGVEPFQVSLRAAYPYWKPVSVSTTTISGLEAMFVLPFYTGNSWWISKFDGNYFNTIINSGNVPVEFKVTFTASGSVENPELYHVDTGQRILIKKTMTVGEKVIVSTEYGKKGVTCINAAGVASNGFRYLSVDSDMSMALLPGPNLLRVDATNRELLGVRIEAPEGVRSGV